MNNRSKNPGFRTMGDLRRHLKRTGASWRADPARADDEPLPIYPTGGMPGAEPVGQPVDLEELAKMLQEDPPTNPWLRERAVARGLLSRGNDPAGTPGRGGSTTHEH